MSAFLVTHEHIHTLLWAGLQHPRLGTLRWHFGNPRSEGELQPETADIVGQMLLDENATGVNHLYNTTNPVQTYGETYTYRPPVHRTWSIPELLNALDCYEYQACEHPNWSGSQAQAFVEALRHKLISELPGYRTGPWTITRSSIPAAARAQRS
jgi:hypothetical protein